MPASPSAAMRHLGRRDASSRPGHLLLIAVVVLLGAAFIGGGLVLTATSPTVADEVETHQVLAGRPPAAADEVVLDVSTAFTQRVRLGDTMAVQGSHPTTLRVVGLVGSGRDDGPATSVVLLALGGVLVLAGLVVVAPAVVRPLPRLPQRPTAPGDATELTVLEPTS